MIGSIVYEISLIFFGVFITIVINHQLKRPRISVQEGGHYYEAGHLKMHINLLVKNNPLSQLLKLSMGEMATDIKGEVFSNEKATINVGDKSFASIVSSSSKLKWKPEDNNAGQALKDRVDIGTNKPGEIRFITVNKGIDGYQISGRDYYVIDEFKKYTLFLSNNSNVSTGLGWDITVYRSGEGIKNISLKIKKHPKTHRLNSKIKVMHGGYLRYLWFLLAGDGK